jgi:hypothetical protein
MNNYWRHKYFEKNSSELHSNIFRSLEIEQYLQKILKDKSFNLHKHKLNFSGFVLNVFLSIYKTEKKTIKNEKVQAISKENLITFDKKIKSYYKSKSQENFSTKTKYVKTLNLYKTGLSKLQKPNKLETIKLNNLPKEILESLNIFTENKYNIILTMQEINFVNRNPKTEQILMNFRKFEKAPFFTEGKTLLTPMVTQKNASKLLSNFIASQLKTKRHNFFFNYLKENLNFIVAQKFSKIEGIKIIIKGRLNNAARSQQRVINIGKISLITIKSKVNYSESTAFTSNGTLGVKVWISEKT